ncbi:protein phosphatase 2C domain-containing protein [Algiphilus sp.]|uniref:PP2C family protein-serine/threonine phosphatase n=1 Tax=Algiphilus sp. TaxID=1872431 RepID=UPI002A66E679|nr:protein phosphatase 2C domain-containing protein [Pseudomonadota bacterium]
MDFDLAGATHEGSVRDHNEDAYGIDETVPVAVLADGMGGLAHGEVASNAVIRHTLSALKNGQSADQAIRSAHREIIDAAAGSAQRMGSTAVVVCPSAKSVRVYWVGDSRAYLFRKGQLSLLTRDHSLVQGLIDAGAITEAEAEHHPNRNVVTRAVGIDDNGDLDIDHIDVTSQSGDRILVCSDGLHGYLPHDRMTSILGEHKSNQAAAEALIAATLQETEAGDNVSVICLTVP